MKFSVATPTRDALGPLQRCVGSVRGQSGVVVQHLVQDACSSDGTREWLANQDSLDWCSAPDAGMYDAINRAWARSTGDVLSWLNADEQYLPGTLARVAAAFEERPSLDFVFGDALVVRPDGAVIAARRETRLSKAFLVNGFLNAYSCTMFFRRRLWDDGILRLNAQFRYASDLDLVLRLLAARRPHAHVNAYLSTFSFDGGNLSCHPQMLDETACIQRSHATPWTRSLGRASRWVRLAERLLGGAYLPEAINYAFAVDATPNYVEVRTTRVGASYRTR